MSVKLFRSAAGVLAASMVIGEHWSAAADDYLIGVPRRYPQRLWSKSPTRPADPIKKAARKRQKKARAITRRNQP